MENLTLEYKKKKTHIKKRLRDFDSLRNAKNEDLFAELCFCILTPQSKAVFCDKAVKELKKSGMLLSGRKDAVRSKLNGVRFPNNKASYLILARRFLSWNSKLRLGLVIESKRYKKTALTILSGRF